jgi:hypothetical protein
VLTDADPGSRFAQGDRSPISLLPADSPAQEGSACHTDGQRKSTEEIVDLSESLYNGAEPEQAAHIADSTPKGRAASHAMLKSSSKMQQDT